MTKYLIFAISIFLVCGCEFRTVDSDGEYYAEDGYSDDSGYSSQPNHQRPPHRPHRPPPQVPGHNRSPYQARMVVTRWDVGGGNFFTPTAKITVIVEGVKAHKITLYSVDSDGSMENLETLSCSHGQPVEFRCEYSAGAESLELRVYDNMERMMARDRRSAH